MGTAELCACDNFNVKNTTNIKIGEVGNKHIIALVKGNIALMDSIFSYLWLMKIHLQLMKYPAKFHFNLCNNILYVSPSACT